MNTEQTSKNIFMYKFDYYRGIDCIKKWCEKLRNYATEIINYKKKEVIQLTDEENKS